MIYVAPEQEIDWMKIEGDINFEDPHLRSFLEGSM
jgi:hypothetical protein